MSDHKGAALLADRLPPAKNLIGDRGSDRDNFRAWLRRRGIEPCIPPKRNRRNPPAYDADVYKRRHKIENMFAKLKDWLRIAMRYDRCAHTFFSAICIACSVIFYLKQ
jgi:putative transposase